MYIANVLNGVVTALFVVVYAAFKIRHFPRNIEELMALPEDFGASEQERLDLSVKCMDDVVNISEEIQFFCLERGIDDRRAHLAGLALEEMAGNIVDYGFEADRKKHTVDVRVVHREDEVLLCIKDDCVKFDPDEFVKMTGKGEDLTKNIGLRIVFRIAKEVKYQNVLGLNVLTMKI